MNVDMLHKQIESPLRTVVICVNIVLDGPNQGLNFDLIHGIKLCTFVYTPGTPVPHLLIPKDTTPRRNVGE